MQPRKRIQQGWLAKKNVLEVRSRAETRFMAPSLFVRFGEDSRSYEMVIGFIPVVSTLGPMWVGSSPRLPILPLLPRSTGKAGATLGETPWVQSGFY